MARIQILELPTIYRENGEDETPFVLVVDQYVPQRYILGPGDDQPQPLDEFDGIAERIGARAVLVFEEAVDIPANEVPVDPDGYPLKIRVEGDFETFREVAMQEIAKVQADLTDALRTGRQ
jgi:hypothetical protein